MRSLAIQILSQGVSSSPCERLWSRFGNIASKKRNRLGAQKANDFVYVNANLRLLDSISGCKSHETYIGWGLEVEDDDTDSSDGQEVASTSYNDDIANEDEES